MRFARDERDDVPVPAVDQVSKRGFTDACLVEDKGRDVVQRFLRDGQDCLRSVVSQ
jgi:hypothetical protein